MINAKEEFLKHMDEVMVIKCPIIPVIYSAIIVDTRKIASKCAYDISTYTEWEDFVIHKLPPKIETEDKDMFDKFLDKLDFEYDNTTRIVGAIGGYIWFANDGGWSERVSIDGIDMWKYKEKPSYEKVLARLEKDIKKED